MPTFFATAINNPSSLSVGLGSCEARILVFAVLLFTDDEFFLEPAEVFVCADALADLDAVVFELAAAACLEMVGSACAEAVRLVPPELVCFAFPDFSRVARFAEAAALSFLGDAEEADFADEPFAFSPDAAVPALPGVFDLVPAAIFIFAIS